MDLQPISNRKKFQFDGFVRKETRERQEQTCGHCGKHNSEVGPLEVHHVLPIYIAFNFFPEVTLAAITSLDNAVGLCHDCHRLIHDGIDDLVQDDLDIVLELFAPVAQSLLQRYAVSASPNS